MATVNLAAPTEFTRYVVERGLMPPGVHLTARELVGGVSGLVVLVQGPDRDVVVKRALSQLHVAATWLAKPERALTEAAALTVCNRLTPEHTPHVLDIDVANLTFAMTAAPPDWPTWKDVLLQGGAGDEQIVDTARRLGAILATWHRATWHDATMAAQFDDYEAFEQLRLTPFHRATAIKHPEVGAALLECAQELLERRECLVHGDFSPKNILVGSGTWVLDFEVAHYGAAVFDVAFLQSHLMLKALHLPSRAAVLAEAGLTMMQEYRRAASDAIDVSNCGRHAACLLLARVDGVSPAPYLSAEAAVQVRAVAVRALQDRTDALSTLWERITAKAAELGGNPRLSKVIASPSSRVE